MGSGGEIFHSVLIRILNRTAHKTIATLIVTGMVFTAFFGVLQSHNFVFYSYFFLTQVADMLGCQQPIGRVGEPEEVSKVVTFLASDAATMITGTTIPLDGGLATTLAFRLPQPPPPNGVN